MLHSVSVVRPSEVPFDITVRWLAALATNKCWNSPFLTPEFAMHVGNQRDDARIIIAKDHQGLLGILGIQKRRGGYARPLGAPVSDHQAFITEPGFFASINEVLEGAKISVFSFVGMNDPEARLKTVAKENAVSHIADLGTGSGQYFAAQQERFGRHFKKMRQRARGAVRDHGTMKLVLDSHDEADFEALLAWKRDQYRRTRKCDVLASDWITGLLHSLWQTNGRVRAVLNVLYLGGQPAAAEIGLMSNGTYHSWIAAYDPALCRCSPGLLLLEGVLQNADTLGITNVDLGAGHDHYKKYYANDEIALGQGKVLGGGLTAHKHYLIDHVGGKLLAGAPARLANAHEFLAACHPDWAGRLRGAARRLAHAVT